MTNTRMEAIPSPSPADLAETVEVKFTQRIKDLAAKLEHHPLKIYNWVRNNIEFVPTYGSIQGAEMCLMTKQGNAFDTSSLLISLLRVSNIPARYVYGTVEIPIDKAMNWVGGVTDPIVAGQILASCGIPARLMYKGEKVVSIQIEHVWVEAYVDYVPSRGAVHKEGDTWIPMDASFKQYTYTEGVNFEQEVPFDWDSITQQFVNSGTINEDEDWATRFDTNITDTAIENYLSQIMTYIENNTSEDVTISDIFGAKQFVQKQYPYLPATLPNKIIVKANQYAEFPDYLRHRIVFDLIKDPVWGTSYFTLTKSLPELAGKKITLSYAPASQADQDLIESFIPEPEEGGDISLDDLPESLPAYLIQLKPQLMIDGEVVSIGSTILMGDESKLNMTFYNTERSDTVSSYTLAGEYTAFALDVQHTLKDQIEVVKENINSTIMVLEQANLIDINKDDIVGDMLYITALSYFSALDNIKNIASKTMDIFFQRLPSVGIFSHILNINYLLNIPTSSSSAGLMMDIVREHSQLIPLDGNMEKRRNYNIITGNISSTLEHTIPETIFSSIDDQIQAISAVKALSVANEQNMPIYTISQENLNNILPNLELDGDVISAISDAVNAGNVVIISKTNIQVGNYWEGCGYIVFDMDSGAAAYMISRGRKGAQVIINFGRYLQLIGMERFGVGDRVVYVLGLIVEHLGKLILRFNELTPEQAEKFCKIMLTLSSSIGGVATISELLVSLTAVRLAATLTTTMLSSGSIFTREVNLSLLLTIVQFIGEISGLLCNPKKL